MRQAAWSGGSSWAGWRQGELMNDPNTPFLAIVEYTKPWLHARSVAGVLMTAGHLSFAWLVWNLVRRRGGSLMGPTLLKRRSAA